MSDPRGRARAPVAAGRVLGVREADVGQGLLRRRRRRRAPAPTSPARAALRTRRTSPPLCRLARGAEDAARRGRSWSTHFRPKPARAPRVALAILEHALVMGGRHPQTSQVRRRSTPGTAPCWTQPVRGGAAPLARFVDELLLSVAARRDARNLNPNAVGLADDHSTAKDVPFFSRKERFSRRATSRRRHPLRLRPRCRLRVRVAFERRSRLAIAFCSRKAKGRNA